MQLASNWGDGWTPGRKSRPGSSAAKRRSGAGSSGRECRFTGCSTKSASRSSSFSSFSSHRQFQNSGRSEWTRPATSTQESRVTSDPGKAQNVNQVRCTRTAGNWRPGGHRATAWQVRGKTGQTGTAPNPTGPSSSNVPSPRFP